MMEIVVRQVRRGDEAERGEGPRAVFVAQRPTGGGCGFVEAAVGQAVDPSGGP
jgi:hypothetical protein